jgi:hypothetical protein
MTGNSAAITFLLACFLSLSADAQESRQTVCQASWERCMSSVAGKDWKPVYDRCVKARTSCLGGEAYTPASTATNASIAVQDSGGGLGSDLANADPETRNARCDNGLPRGDNRSCTLVPAGEGYGQNFSLLGPGVPQSRIQRASSVVKCAGGAMAQFYANGRIESCVLDNYGAQGVALTDYSGKTMTCASRAVARFDAEGRVLSCSAF